MRFDRRTSARSLALRAGLIGALVAAPGSVFSQTFVPGPVALKRVAEALDGNRTGKPAWVVISSEPTNPVPGVFGGEDEARRFVIKAGPTAHVLGPYETESDPLFNTVSFCVHLQDKSAWRCVGGPSGPPTRPEIGGLTLLITRTNGAVDTIPLPVESDAIFLGKPAVDKFVIPYYLRTVGFDAVAGMRRELAETFAPRPSPRL